MNKTQLKKLESECKKIWKWKEKWENYFEQCVIKQNVQLSFNFKQQLVIYTYDCCVMSNTINFCVEFMDNEMEFELSECEIQKTFPDYFKERCDIMNKIDSLNLRYGPDHFLHETSTDCWNEILKTTNEKNINN